MQSYSGNNKMKKYKLIIKNPNRMKEFEKLNNYANWTSKYCRVLYKRYCNNLTKIREKIIKENKDFEIEIKIVEDLVKC